VLDFQGTQAGLSTLTVTPVLVSSVTRTSCYMTTTIGRTLHCVSRLLLFHISRFCVLWGLMVVCYGLAGAPSRKKGLCWPWVVG
jgi:hypothetical protein